MNKESLLMRLKELATGDEEGDKEDWHEEADRLILEYLNDQEITDAFREIPKWYS